MSQKRQTPAGDRGNGGATGRWATSKPYIHHSVPQEAAQVKVSGDGWAEVLRLRDKAIALGHDAIRREMEALALRKLEAER